MKPLTKSLLIFLALSFGIAVKAQKTDTQIVEAIYRHNVVQLKQVLDSLGVYSVVHLDKLKGDDDKELIVSIADTTVRNDMKVYTIVADETGKVTRIVINYRHDNYFHMKDLASLKGIYVKHVGRYSTDVTFDDPEKAVQKSLTKKFLELHAAKKYAKKLLQRTIYYYNNKYFYVGIVTKEDDDFVYFKDGKIVSKDKLYKIN